MKLFSPASFESLETRRLFVLVAAVNFQPAGANVPAGYVADAGNAFASRNGLQYGWDAAITSATRDRNAPNSPDQRYDTLIHTQLSGSHKWELAVTNGTYLVTLVAGDPSYFNSVYQFNVEGVLALSGTPTSSNRWIESSSTVNVTDGRLTLTNAAGSSNNKLAFLLVERETSQPPFGGVPVSLPGTLQAENFDEGGQTVAYFDTTSGNTGGVYRNTDVDIQATNDTGGGYHVAYTRAGEWLEYTVDVAAAGTYSLEIRLASANGGGTFHVNFDGISVTGSVVVPNTGGWSTWKTITRSNISLHAGRNIVRISFDSAAVAGSGIANINWLRVTPASASDWSTGTSAPVALGEVAGGIINNKLYLVGEGSNVTLAYDIAANSWVSNLAVRPYVGNHHAAEVFNGKLYLFGGLGGSSGGMVQIYNPSTNSWTTGAAMPFAAGSSSSAVIDGYIYVAGGIVGTSTTNQVARYDPVANAWTSLAPMPQGRNHAASSTDGSELYIFGGRGPGSGDSNTVANGFNTVQIYDPATNTWQSSQSAGSTLAPLPQARGGMGKGVYFGGEFYVIGGETLTGAGTTSNHVYDRVDIYNPGANTWRLGEPMPTARHGIFPLLAAGKLYIAVGGVTSGESKSNVLEILNLS